MTDFVTHDVGTEMPLPVRMTDADFLLHVLSDGRAHSLNEILQRSFRERGCGLTVHSRAADLRKRGVRVANWKDGDRGAGSWYRLGTLESGGSTGTDAIPSPPDSSGPVELPPELDGGAAQLTLQAPQFRRQEAA